MVEDEDPEVGRGRELLLNPRVAAAADVPVVEVGLARVDCDNRYAVEVNDRVALTEELLEMDVADVARVVVARNDDERIALEAVQVGLRLRVLLLEAECGQVSGARAR
jgi:hypothetical protein